MKCYYPLTHPQKRVWVTELIYPGTSLYNIGGTIRFKGAVDLKRLEEAILIFLKNNEGLRLRFKAENEEASQYVAEYQRVRLDFYDFGKSPDPEAEFLSWTDREAGKVLPLIDSDLYYFALFKITEGDQGYFVRFHHLIADGWSVNIMTGQIVETYLKLSEGTDIHKENGHSYLEYLDLERKYLASERFLKDKIFWNQKFRELPEVCSIQNTGDTEGRRKTFQLDESSTKSIQGYLKQNKVSLNTFCIAVFLTYFYKGAHQSDLVIGTPVANRSGQKEKAMVGMFTSTMPFRFRVNGEESFQTLISRVDAELRECYFHQKYPYDLLVQDLELKQKGCEKLFDICVNYYNTRLNTDLAGVPIENREFYNGRQIYALQWVIKDWSDSAGYTWDFDFQTGSYNDFRIDQMYRHLNMLIGQILARPESMIDGLQLLSESERHWVFHEFNATRTDYPSQKTINQLFEEQVNRTPEKIALVCRERSLTYRALNEKANQLAHLLRRNGAGPNTVTALMVSHTLEMVIGIWGILKAGGAYLPIDPGYPAERIGFMLKDAACSIFLSNIRQSEAVPFDGLRLDPGDPGMYQGESANPEPANGPEDLAYIIYTSGSTGKPKGVMIEHRGLVNYICWARKMYLRNEDEAFALYSSLAFDLTVTSVFTPLINGNRIYIYDNEDHEFVLHKILRENRVNIIKLTPAHLSLLTDRDNRSSAVRRFIVGGEDLKVKLAMATYHSFNGQIEIYNEYGPTETVVGCMIHRYDTSGDTGNSVPIGVPADNTQIYVLDERLNPAPIETPGEIYISGDGVARGYLNQPGLTAEKFVPNPFTLHASTRARDFILPLMYRTGDLARHGWDGKMVYCGRNDHQIKLLGYRIELAEIEKHLLRVDTVKEALVLDGRNPNGDPFLCAYLVADAGLNLSELKRQLAQSLPDYMIPRYFLILDQLPLTSNGKVNRNALPRPSLKEAPPAGCIDFNNDNEAILCRIIADILDVEKVGREDNFFQLGGDSIKAIQIAAKLNEYGLKIKAKDILAHPVPAEMAVHLESIPMTPVNPGPCEGFILKTPITAWFWEQQFSKPDHYNQSVLLKMKREIALDELEKILHLLVRHHDGLRLNYHPETGRLFYNNLHLEQPGKITVFDLSADQASEQQRRIALLGEEFKSTGNITADLLFKACLFDLGPGGKCLLLTAHHMVIDGVSWRIILEDFARLIGQMGHHSAMELQNKTHSYQSWAAALTDYGEEIVNREAEYWNEVTGNEFFFPMEPGLDNGSSGNPSEITLELTREETGLFLFKANTAYHTTTEEILVIALALVMSAHCGQSKIMLELEGHGREDLFPEMDLSRTAGWFTSIYPVRMIVPQTDLGNRIKSLKEQLRQIPNRGIGFGILKYLAKVSFLEHYQSKGQIRFNYLGEIDQVISGDIFEFSADESGADCSRQNRQTCLFEIIVMVMAKRLRITVRYNRDQYRDQTIAKFADDYVKQLQILIEHCCAKDRSEFTPSDFEMADLSQGELDQLFG